jgi:glycerophosphoryl diester phosphodiesterase
VPKEFQVGFPADANFPNLRGDLHAELALFMGLGLDGVFRDQPDVAVATRTGLSR